MFNKILLFAIFSIISVSNAMRERRMCIFTYDGGSFQMTVKKTGKIDLTQTEENNIRHWIERKLGSDKQREALERQVLEFINAPVIKSSQKPFDVWDYAFTNYYFRRFQLNKEEPFFDTTEKDCQSIAKWLKAQHIEEHTDERQRLKVVNQGKYFLLTAKDCSIYEKLAYSQIRKEAMQKHKFIAFLAIEGELCKDITNEALSLSKLQFKFKSLKN